MPDDQQLVHHFLKTRSEKAFRKLYRAITPKLYPLALRLSGHQETYANDLIQEMWMRAIRKLPDFQWKSSLKTWLTRILINADLERNRQNKTRKKLKVIHVEEQKKENIQEKMDLEKAIAQLPQGCKRILLLHDIEGFTHKEIAEMLNMSIGNSKSQLFQARKKMKKFLSEYSPKKKTI